MYHTGVRCGSRGATSSRPPVLGVVRGTGSEVIVCIVGNERTKQASFDALSVRSCSAQEQSHRRVM